MPAIEYPINRRLTYLRQLAAAAHRRQQLAGWVERYEAIQQIIPRDDEERQAQHQALVLMEQTRPVRTAMQG